MARINPNKEQVEYWKKRSELDFLAGEKKGLRLAESLKSIYERSIKQLEKDILVFYSKYAQEGKVSYKEAKKLLNKDELRSFQIEIKELMDYAKEHNFTKQEKLNIKLMSLKARVSRLEELKTQMEFEVTKLTKMVEEKSLDFFDEAYEDNYYKTVYNLGRTIGYDSSFAKINKDLINKATKKNYNLGNYSVGINNIWINKDNLMKVLNQEIPRGLALGLNAKVLAKDVVSKKLNSNYNAAVRLIRTEYNYLFNQSTKLGYDRHGVRKYQILATLDNRTSDICMEMNGEIFDISEMEVGVNYPPFHPNCRTTTIAYFEPTIVDTIAPIDIEVGVTRDGKRVKIPDGMSYKEWLKSLK